MADTQDDGDLKRLAVQVVAQLPPNTDDALAVLRHARASEMFKRSAIMFEVIVDRRGWPERMR